MKKIIRTVDQKKGIVQVTCADERWYIKQITNEKTGLPEFEFVPSVTWIAGCYPKGIAFYKWLGSKGWDESQALMQAAGDKGSKVHYAITDYLNGIELKIDAKYISSVTEKEEELTYEEWECLMSFDKFMKDIKPVILKNEVVIFNEEIGYAGTIDIICLIDDTLWLLDNKTSSYIWPEYELQISAYKYGIAPILKELGLEGKFKEIKLGILQLGYRMNKKGYKLTEVPDKFDLFLHAKAIWQNEHSKEKPSQKDYPLMLKYEPETKQQEKVSQTANESSTNN